jgi:hypothetical protein
LPGAYTQLPADAMAAARLSFEQPVDTAEDDGGVLANAVRQRRFLRPL